MDSRKARLQKESGLKKTKLTKEQQDWISNETKEHNDVVKLFRQDMEGFSVKWNSFLKKYNYMDEKTQLEFTKLYSETSKTQLSLS